MIICSLLILNITSTALKTNKKGLTNKIVSSYRRLAEAFLKDKFLFSAEPAGPSVDVCRAKHKEGQENIELFASKGFVQRVVQW